MLEALKREGVDYLFSNLGSDHPPILEALARVREQDRLDDFPEVVTCPHEFAAVSAAHGYAAASGAPQGVLLHVDVGTSNAGSALHNAHRAHVPMFVLAGLAPVTETGRPGSRDTTVHYIQDVPDQVALVEQYCRWTSEYRLPADPAQTVRRGLERATAPPAGPVYVAAAREALESTDYQRSPDGRNRRAIEPPSAPEAAIDELADLVASAARPVVVTSNLGDDRDAVGALVAFAERTETGVVEHRPSSLSFPRDHPLHLGYAPTELFDRADLLIVAASDVPWVPHKGSPPSDTTVVQVDLDPTKPDYPLWDFDVDRTLTADPGDALSRLAGTGDAVEAGATGWREVAADRRAEVAAALRKDREAGRLTPAVLSAALAPLVDDTTVLVDDAVTSKGAVLDHIEQTEPGSYHMKGGSALGWAPGAAVGVKMASPDRRVIDVTGDGAYVFSNPTASAWLAASQGTPVMTVVYNNGGWNAVRGATAKQHPDGLATRDEVPESHFRPELDLSVPAKAIGALTRRVDAIDGLEPALSEAIEAIEGGTPAVVDVRLESFWERS